MEGQKYVPQKCVSTRIYLHLCLQAITRYTVPALASVIRSLKEARETRTGIVRDFKLRVFAEFDADRDVWLRAVKVTAELDCLLSLAKASEALGSPSCRPEFVDEAGGKAIVEFVNLRHPALELSMKKEFIANSVRLGELCAVSGELEEMTNSWLPLVQAESIRMLL
jgi:DNA mismatch repair protein MSH6